MPIVIDRRGFLKQTASAAALWAFSKPLSRRRRIPRRAALRHPHRGRSERYFSWFFPHANLRKAVDQVSAGQFEMLLVNGDMARLLGKPEDYQAFNSFIDPSGRENAAGRHARQSRRAQKCPRRAHQTGRRNRTRPAKTCLHNRRRRHALHPAGFSACDQCHSRPTGTIAAHLAERISGSANCQTYCRLCSPQSGPRQRQRACRCEVACSKF